MDDVAPRIAVVGSVGPWHWDDLNRAATGCCHLVRCRYEDLCCRLDAESCRVICGDMDLGNCCGVLCRAMPRGSLEQVVLRMDALSVLEQQGTPVLNSSRAIEVCIDKFLALARLQAAGLPVPPTVACQTADDADEAFESLGSDVVVKPVFGSEGRGLLRVNDPGLARRVFQALERSERTIYVQKFIRHHGWDLRLLVIGEELFAMKRSRQDDWRLNASRGAGVSPFEPDETARDLARRTANVLATRLAGIDLIYDEDGRPLLLEVNACPGWRYLAEILQVDIAKRVLNMLLGMRSINRR